MTLGELLDALDEPDNPFVKQMRFSLRTGVDSPLGSVRVRPYRGGVAELNLRVAGASMPIWESVVTERPFPAVFQRLLALGVTTE